MATPVRAEAPDDLSQLSLEQLLALPVDAPAKLDQPMREAPAIGALVTDEQLELYGWDSLNDVLYRQPGFSPSQDYERLTVAARGMFEGWNNNRLLVLVDGVPVNNVTNGIAYTFEITPLFMLRSIEIVRGPGSALYGTNATNGVLALNTRAPDRDVVDARLRLGNVGTLSLDLFGSQRFSWLAAEVALQHLRTDGNIYDSYDASGRTDASGELQKFEVKDQLRSYYVFTKLQGARALAGLSLQLHLQVWQFETAQGWLYIVPDEDERLWTNRELLALSYRPPRLAEGRLETSYVLQWQRGANDYRVKYYPDGYQIGTTVFPGGNVEIAKYSANSLFARAQASYRAWRDTNLLLGVENLLLLFANDDVHESNVDLSHGGTGLPFPDGQFHPLDPVYEPVVHEPIDSIAGFAQLATGRVLGDLLAATLGMRYDLQFFHFRNLDAPGEPRQRKSFSQWSPRAGLVLFPWQGLTVKLLAERAFRAPAPTEQFASNTYLGTTSAEKIQAEQTTTYTLAGDLMLLDHLDLRADVFHERAANQIAFSSTYNYSANLYTRKLVGAETELLFDAKLAHAGTLWGFANYTFVHLLDETVEEPTITASDRLTWGPQHVWNLGLAFSTGALAASAQGHYQGRVERRPSDHLDASGVPTFFSQFRPESVAPWLTVDARLSYRVGAHLRLGVQATNLLDTPGHLVKPGNYPFDFQIEARRVLGTLEYAYE
jgi:outer membrane receptor protein involved in Fe transport